ncbi:MAG: F0F1 ATP synthase subunit A [Clostridia bacterium]|nr:F0F1 ATP synthase subunit A [Clostridia bacterium]
MFGAKAAYAAEAGGDHGPQILFNLFGLPVTSEVTTTWGIILILGLASYFATRNMKRIPSGIQNVMEYAVESLIKLFAGVMGEKKAKRFLPLLGTLFLFILLSNYSGLLPGAGHTPGLKAPTSTWSVTLGLALVVIISVQIYGVKERGLDYFKHFVQPIPVMLPMNIIEQFTRPLSLSLRLFGNVYGEEMVVAGLFALVPLILPLPMMFLGLLFGFIQAFVFTLLATVYIAEATETHH